MTKIGKFSALATTMVVAAALAVAPAGPAFAAGTLTVKVTGGGNFTGTAKIAVLKDTKTGNTVTCRTNKTDKTAASTIGLSVPTKNYPSSPAPVGIGKSAAQEFNNCLGPASVGVDITPITEPMHLFVDSVTTNTSETDLPLDPVDLDVNAPTVNCSFTVKGAARAFYSAGTATTPSTLTLRPELPLPLVAPVKALTIGGVTAGCGTLVNNGDHVTMSITYALTPATLVINSTSP